MRHTIIVTALSLLAAACGPTVEHDELDIAAPPSRVPAEGAVDEDEGGSTGLGGSEGEDPEHGSGGGSGGSEGTGGDSEGGSTGADVEPQTCSLPQADTPCWAIIEAAEGIDCDAIGGACWAVVASNYAFGDAQLAQDTATCETGCEALEDACSLVLGPPYPQTSVCLMVTEADCLANAAGAGIAWDPSVALTCTQLAATYG